MDIKEIELASFGDSDPQTIDEKEPIKLSTNLQAGINMFKCFLGIGILGLSQGFEKAGIILSPLILFFVYGTSYYTTTLIIGKFIIIRCIERIFFK